MLQINKALVLKSIYLFEGEKKTFLKIELSLLKTIFILYNFRVVLLLK